jgi:hypothetical protein
MNRRTVALVAVAIIASLVLGTQAKPAMAVTGSDDFNDNAIDSAKWTAVVRGTGPSIAETNQRLEITLPANSANDPQSGDFSAYYQSVSCLSGDFNIQVDYQLTSSPLTWPSLSGVRVGLTLDGYAVERVGPGPTESPPEVYTTDFNHVGNSTPTSDLSGKLRLTRSGGVLTGYYYNSGWVQMATATFVADTRYHLSAWSHDDKFGDQLTKVAFDNFVVNSGTLGTCPVNTPTPTPRPASVGGIAELPNVDAAPVETRDSSGPGAGALAGITASAAAVALALAGVAWYARRRRET